MGFLIGLADAGEGISTEDRKLARDAVDKVVKALKEKDQKIADLIAAMRGAKELIDYQLKLNDKDF